MAQIAYIGFTTIIETVKKKFPPKGNIVFSEILPLTVETDSNVLQDCDLFLIGPFATDPVKQAQRANQKNPLVSVVIQVFPEQLQKTKQALLMSYSLGKNVICLSFDTTRDITAVLENAMLKTRQRKSFHRIANPAVSSVSANKEITFGSPSDFLENIFLGTLILDENKVVISANGAARGIFNVLSQNRGTVHIADLFPNGAWFDRLTEIAQENSFLTAVTDAQLYLEIHPSIIKTDQNKSGYLLLINDVTDKVTAENALKVKIEELEFLNQELDQFTDVVSHDFKTPITAIGLLTELATNEQDPGKKQLLLNRIKTSADKLKDLLNGLNRLVDLKKGKSDKVELIYFEERLAIALCEYQHTLDEMGAEVIADFSEAPSMYYFQAHIDIYLGNLLTNAIKYRDADKPLRINIHTRMDNNYVRLSVKDNGMGMDLTKNMHKLFQPFKRLTDLGTGSGLGLSIVKRMIEKEHGYLEVYSMPGEGTEFTAYLKEFVQ